MYFYINHINDTSIPNNAEVLPILRMMLINDGRHDYMKFHEKIQNADITFSMFNEETGTYQVANSKAFIKRLDGECCTEEYEICYQFKKREVSKPGTYKGYFMINFGKDLKNDNYTYPEGVLKMPIRDELNIIVR